MIGEKFNFYDTYFRDLIVCTLNEISQSVTWINRFDDKDVFVEVPFYYSMSGDERFLLDSFTDDIVSDNRHSELNTDVIPRGHLTMTSFNINSSEFCNPNVFLKTIVEDKDQIKSILSKVRALPITVNFDLEILLASELDTFKCSQALMNTMYMYKYMYFEYNFMNIDAVIQMPDNQPIEMVREKNLNSDNTIKMKLSFTVETYYPAYRTDLVKGVGLPQKHGSGMSDLNGHSFAGGISERFNQPNEVVPLGEDKGFYNSDGTTSPSDLYGSNTSDDYTIIAPKRTKWYDEILKAREQLKIKK